MFCDMAAAPFFSVIIKALMWFLFSKFNTVAFTRISVLEIVYVCLVLTIDISNVFFDQSRQTSM